jgi:hypothetical protein
VGFISVFGAGDADGGVAIFVFVYSAVFLFLFRRADSNILPVPTPHAALVQALSRRNANVVIYPYKVLTHCVITCFYEGRGDALFPPRLGVRCCDVSKLVLFIHGVGRITPDVLIIC